MLVCCTFNPRLLSNWLLAGPRGEGQVFGVGLDGVMEGELRLLRVQKCQQQIKVRLLQLSWARTHSENTDRRALASASFAAAAGIAIARAETGQWHGVKETVDVRA